MNAKELYEMKLGEILHTDNASVLRVPGGWVFIVRDYADMQIAISTTFVPMNSEFRRHSEFRRQEPKA